MEIHGTRDALGALAAAGEARGNEAARGLRDGKDTQAAHAFESFFAQVFVREMRRGLPQGFFGGAGSDVYSSWLDQHVGDALASTGALGIGDLVRAALGREGNLPADEAPVADRPEETR